MTDQLEKKGRDVVSFPVPDVDAALPFTGERFTTVMTGGIEQEHRHRYLFALPYCEGKTVLDIASGEGYGSSMLAERAAQVTGVDISVEAIAHATKSYARENLQFIQGSATAIPLPEASIDVIVSFETIEHFAEHDAFVQEIRRVLRPDGLLIISSPNAEIYSETDGNHNEFHVRELTRQEFADLFATKFRNIRHFEQKATSASIIVPIQDKIEDGPTGFTTYRRIGPGQFEQKDGQLIRGVYSLIMASDVSLPHGAHWSVLEDERYASELFSVIQYNEYLISERDKEIDRLRSEASELLSVVKYNEYLISERLQELDEVRKEASELLSVVKYNEHLIDKQDGELSAAKEKLKKAETEAAGLSNSLAIALADVEQNKKLLAGASDALRERIFVLNETFAQLNSSRAHSEGLQRSLDAVLSSTSWRMTEPLRIAAGTLAKFSRLVSLHGLRAAQYLARRGVIDAMFGLADPVKRRQWFQPHASVTVQPDAAMMQRQQEAYLTASPKSAHQILSPNVVIIAELSLAQCAKYRVWQKRDHFRRLGIPVTVVDWTNHSEARNALQSATIAIWYRVPGYPEVLEIISEARRLGVQTFWEVDDLIFDEEAYQQNRNLASLSPELRRSVLSGVPLYRGALASVAHAIASTRVLGEQMKKAGADKVFIVENCLDAETLRAAEAARQGGARATKRPGEIRIIYGSGSKAHDADFACAADALAEILADNSAVILEIIGELTLPAVLEPFRGQVERTKFTVFTEYLERLSRADISLAPLESTLFNDAKSNIKYLEASILGIPSVCSRADAFVSAIAHGETGYLASSTDEWKSSLTALIDNEELRDQIGSAARARVLAEYSWTSVADSQVAPIISAFAPRTPKKLRVLTVNVYFAPQSFGGATIVAEELVSILAQEADLQVSVVTSHADPDLPDYAIRRYEAKHADCFAIKLPRFSTRSMDFENVEMRRVFRSVLDAVRPDVVHFHSIQGLSASLAEACLDLDIPYVITLHDAWWICERQFMVTSQHKYCFQEKIDLEVCRTCVPDFGFTLHRRIELSRILSLASALLAPSSFHRNLHIANGVLPDKIRVNKNGVKEPHSEYQKVVADHLRFAHVGGIGPIKGQDLVFKAFAELPHTNYQLKIVDNMGNLGVSAYGSYREGFNAQTVVVPAYSQATIDEFFAGVDVLLFPSQWKESFGLTVREALLRDVWVIVTDAGGAAEDVIDGVNGTIIPLTPEPSHEPLREAIRALLDDPAKLKAYQNPHKDRIVTFRQQAEELRKILEEVVEVHGELLLGKNALRGA